MSDEEIKRNLSQCENGYSQQLHLARCKIEELKNLCTSEDKLIKELRAEIERLQDLITYQKQEIKEKEQKYNQVVDDMFGLIETTKNEIAEAKSEAIKEFAEKLKEMAEHGWIISGVQDYAVSLDNIDNLVQKMVGGENA